MSRYNYNLITEYWLESDPIFRPYLKKLEDRGDRNFIIEMVDQYPKEIKAALLKNAFSKKSRNERNTYLRYTTQKINEYLPPAIRANLSIDEDEIANLAERHAKKCQNIAKRGAKQGSKILRTNAKKSETGGENSRPVSHHFCVNGLMRNVSNDYEEKEALTEMLKLCAQFNFEESEVLKKGVTVKGAIKRLCDKSWWNRKLRVAMRQAFEKAARELNLVNRFTQIYASDYAVRSRRYQKLKNENILNSIFVVNELGQKYSLKELSDLNVSNPAVRKAELMVRMRGFENYSLEHGHKGLFLTITCPSKYHSSFAKSGQPNPKFQGFTPFQANQYLNKNWQRVRAELARRSIDIYGFRVAEPQHDGTPHWHMLLFFEPKFMGQIIEVIRHYALMDDGEEKGAQENRCDFKKIDPKKGSATGYIAKYVSKNIDGENLDTGVYGDDPKTSAMRVEAWASCWCIRQFQQIGGASVTVWREMRRLRNSMIKDKLLSRIHTAADSSDWNGYIKAMGGVFSKRKDHPIKPAYEYKADKRTGEVKSSYFDNTLIKTLQGIRYQGKLIVTRFFNWKIERAVDSSNLEFCK